MKSYLGIDPGASGGMAFIFNGATTTTKMPVSDREIWNWIKHLKSFFESEPFAVIEKVGGFIAGNPAPGSAMFNFGKSYGGLLMALTAAGIPFEEVPPQRWLKGMNIPTRQPHDKKRTVVITKGKNKGKTREERYGGETTSDFKNRLKRKAEQLFPELEITLAVADAILIAEYCRRRQTGFVEGSVISSMGKSLV